MEKIGNITVLSLLIVLFTSSCTLEKRVHLKGYHIEWNGVNNSAKKSKLVKKEIIHQNQEEVRMADSVGTFIKDVLSKKGESNYDSLNDIIAELILFKVVENNLQASREIEPNSRVTSLNPVSFIPTRKIDSKIANNPSFDRKKNGRGYNKKGLGAGWIVLIVFGGLLLILAILVIIALENMSIGSESFGP